MQKNRSRLTVSRREALVGTMLAGAGMALDVGCASNGGRRASTQAKPLRIAHLTDMHVQPERRAAEGYAAALQSLAKLDPAPDLIVTGGDHVFDALRQPLDRTRLQWDLYAKVLAANTKLPVRPVLGNHDIWGWGNPEEIPLASPGYGKAMGLDRLGLTRSYYGFDAGAWRGIVLDSMIQRNNGYYADLGPEQTEWLKGELQAIGPSRPIVIFSHIPIVAVCVYFSNDNRLQGDTWTIPDQTMHHDARQLLDLLGPYNVRLLVSGHVHSVDRAEYRGMTFICDGAVSGNWWRGPRLQFPEGYGLFDLHSDGHFDHRYVPYGWRAVREGE